jgi:glycolate oxidase
LLPQDFVHELASIVGEAFVRVDDESRAAYGIDGTKQAGHPAGAVVLPASTSEISRIVRACAAQRVPFVPRGAGTGYTGGAVPLHGGVVISLERMNRILEIDEANLLAVVEPNVINGDLQKAVEARGLFYPPDPASVSISAIGGNVAENAGGPRAFKYGTTKQYVLGLEAVLPTGEIIETGGKTVKNVVGYDLTHLLVGSEGTLAIITKMILRLLPKPPVQISLRASFDSVAAAADAVTEIVRRRVVPSALELIDGESLAAIAAYAGKPLAPAGTAAILLLEVDGTPAATGEEAARVEDACRAAGATELLRAKDEAEAEELWRIRRDLSYALRTISPIKFNHDVVVPKGRIPELFELVERLRREFRLRIPCFGHAGDGNIHVNIMVAPDDKEGIPRAQAAERALMEGVVRLEGSISGEHGIGYKKLPFIGLELSPETIAIMKRVKAAFDPHNLLNPGKIFPA